MINGIYISEFIFLENGASYGKMLFCIYDLFSHVVEISVDHLLSFGPELTKFEYQPSSYSIFSKTKPCTINR